MKKFNKPYIRNGRFCHDLEHKSAGFFFSSVFMMLKSLWLRTSKSRIDAKDFVCDLEFSRKSSEDPVITWLGHASFLIQIGGKNILTDPVLGEACLLYKILYKRRFKVGISSDNLPNIDFVLISHNHVDHMDEESLIVLKSHKNINFLVPKGNKRWFDKRGFEGVREYCWWECDSFACNLDKNVGSKEVSCDKNINSDSEKSIKISLDKNIKFVFLPASHWSQRGLFDKNKTLWGSWLIEYNPENNDKKFNNFHDNDSQENSGSQDSNFLSKDSQINSSQVNNFQSSNLLVNSYKIFFAGDTGYDSHFKEISQEYKNIDVALMPIGPCEPRRLIAHHHVDAQEAVNAFLDLNAKHFVPMHWGTFPLGAEVFDLPLTKLVKSWLGFYGYGLLEDKKLHLPKIGEQIEFAYSDFKSQQVSKLKEKAIQELESEVKDISL